MGQTVLLIMRPSQLRESTADGLTRRCIEVEVAESLCVRGRADLHGADVGVLELPVAEADVHEVCSWLRENGLPGIIALGERGCLTGAVEALQAGADDYLSRPLSPLELIARVRALLRRLTEYRASSHRVIDLGEIVVNYDRREVKVRGEEIPLTPREFELLCELARNAGSLMPREQLLQRIWGYDEAMVSRTLDVHIGRLRKKLESDPTEPELIETVPRVGYRLAA